MDIPSVKNLKIGMQALDLVTIAGPKLKLVLNRANTQVKLDVREIEQVLGIRADFPIPSDIAVPLSVNAGVPVVLLRAAVRRGPGARPGRGVAARLPLPTAARAGARLKKSAEEVVHGTAGSDAEVDARWSRSSRSQPGGRSSSGPATAARTSACRRSRTCARRCTSSSSPSWARSSTTSASPRPTSASRSRSSCTRRSRRSASRSPRPERQDARAVGVRRRPRLRPDRPPAARPDHQRSHGQRSARSVYVERNGKIVLTDVQFVDETPRPPDHRQDRQPGRPARRRGDADGGRPSPRRLPCQRASSTRSRSAGRS